MKISITSLAGRGLLSALFCLCLGNPMLAGAADLIQVVEPNESTGTSMATVVERAPLAHTRQMLPFNDNGLLLGRGNVARQTEAVLDNVARALTAAGSGMDQIAKLNIYLRTNAFRAEVEEVLARKFKKSIKPAVTFVAGDLIHPDALIVIDAVGVVTRNVSKERVPKIMLNRKTGAGAIADAAIMPGDGVVYISGMAEKGELGDATRKTLEKLQAAIGHLGLKKQDVVQLKVFMQPMSEIETVRKTIASFFGDEAVPPVVFVEWISATVPVEIELIAAAPLERLNAEEPIRYITPPGTTGSPVYSRVARVDAGKRIYISGLSGNSEEPEKQVADIFSTFERLLKKAGSDFDHLAKATYYFSDPKANAALDKIRPTIYKASRPPTASKARVKDAGALNRGITIDLIAVPRK